jgi:hypothetical protein
VGGYDEKLKAGCECMDRCRDTGGSNSEEWSSNGRISGESLERSRDTLDLESRRSTFCDCFCDMSLDEMVASSECCCSGDADDDPARRSKSSSLLLSFLR